MNEAKTKFKGNNKIRNYFLSGIQNFIFSYKKDN
jgi:hypothetical protein